ncbi:hypothetical protein RJT34_24307 [Clitoria ternatea]|uniref:C2H2-type domain-containing protein n=1 Tax=Clitoria ternatea TaxID=43366 RepID=A0AAN9FN01_CLITE
MANGFCNNLRRDVLNYAQHLAPYNNNNGPIACRLCNQSFTSIQGLLAHVESHMAHEEVAIRRLYSSPHQQYVNPQMHLASHHHLSPQQPIVGDDDGMRNIFHASPPPLAMPHQPIARTPFFNASQVGSSQPSRKMQLSPPFISYAGKNDDPTKAYLIQLEKPIKKIDFIDLVHMDDEDNNDEQEIVDLDLKL